jgi:hypothetical protein
MVVLIMIFAMIACGGIDNTEADMAGAVVSGDVTNDDGSSDASSEPEDTADEQILASGNWYGVDGFSNEAVDGLVIVIHSATAAEVVFDYSSPATSVTNVTANLTDGQYAYVELGDGVELDMNFTASQIEVSEIEGMGAMLYYFYQ